MTLAIVASAFCAFHAIPATERTEMTVDPEIFWIVYMNDQLDSVWNGNVVFGRVRATAAL
jgi:hypothetical protein